MTNHDDFVEGTHSERRVKMGDIADDINEVFSLQSSVFKAIGEGEDVHATF